MRIDVITQNVSLYSTHHTKPNQKKNKKFREKIKYNADTAITGGYKTLEV